MYILLFQYNYISIQSPNPLVKITFPGRPEGVPK